MFFTWTGKGVVVLYILLAAILPTVFLYVFGMQFILGPIDDSNSALDNQWFMFAFYLLVVAIGTYPLGRFFLKEPERRTLIDPKTGEHHIIVTEHTALYIPMKYQTYIFFAGCVICLLVGFMKLGGLF